MRGAKPKLEAIAGGLSRLPPAPAWLPSEAKAEWRRVVPGLRERKTITRQDLQVLEAYCLACGLVRSSQKIIAAEGDMIATTRERRSGTLRTKPCFKL